jgi:hypothetical protein
LGISCIHTSELPNSVPQSENVDIDDLSTRTHTSCQS